MSVAYRAATILLFIVSAGFGPCSEGADSPKVPEALPNGVGPVAATGVESGARSQKDDAVAKVVHPSQKSGAYHSVFSLKDNRTLAHLIRKGGLRISASTPGFAKYLNFGRPWKTWKLGAHEGEQVVAIAVRSVTWLTFPLSPEQVTVAKENGHGEITLRVKSPMDQGLRVEVNRTTKVTARLHSGWQRITLKIPPGGLQAGENKIAFKWAKRGRLGGIERAYAALSWLHVGPLPEEDDSVVVPDAPLRDDKLWLPVGGGVAFYLYPYSGARLRLRAPGLAAGKRCEVIVSMTSYKRGPVVERRVSDAAGALEMMIDLGAVSDQVVRIALEVRAQGERDLASRADDKPAKSDSRNDTSSSECTGIALDQAAIVMAGSQPHVDRAAVRAAAPKNILFWLVDNARADRYRLYNPTSHVETPTIDRLGKTGTVFKQAYIVGTESRVSHAAIWTGLYPKQHRFIRAKSKLNRGWTTLPEALKAAGLQTAAWVANGNISKFWGFAEGWTSFENTLHDGGGLSAKALANHAISFISKPGRSPFFLYVGTIDPHVSWRGQEPWLSRYDSRPYSGRFQRLVWGKDWDRIARHPQRVNQRDRARIQAIYESTISYNDAHLGRVLAALEANGLRDQTMVVLTADHGEEFWEHGRVGHGGSLNESVIAVPLIIHYPPLFGKGVQIHEGVNVHSLMATIIDAIGAKIPDEVQAGSLLPLVQGVGRGYPRAQIATQYEFSHALRLERYKIRVGGKGVPRVFDLGSEDGEHLDIGKDRPRVTRLLSDILTLFLIHQNRWRESRWGMPSNHSPRFAKDLEEGSGPAAIVPARSDNHLH